MKKEEIVYVPMKRYRTPKGKKTCASNFVGKKYCSLLKTDICEQNYFCGMTDERLTLNKEGFLIPLRNCPVWSKSALKRTENEK